MLFCIKETETTQTNKPKTNTDHHNGDLKLRFFCVCVSFTHFKWLTF